MGSKWDIIDRSSPTYKKYGRKAIVIFALGFLCSILGFLLSLHFNSNENHVNAIIIIASIIFLFTSTCASLIRSAYAFNRYSTSSDRLINGDLYFIGWLIGCVFSSVFFMTIPNFSFVHDYPLYYLGIKSIYILCLLGIIKVAIMTTGMMQVVKYVTEDSSLKKDIALMFLMMLFMTYIGFSEYVILAWRWNNASMLVLIVKGIIFTLAVFAIWYFLRRKNHLIKAAADKCDALFQNKNNAMPLQ